MKFLRFLSGSVVVSTLLVTAPDALQAQSQLTVGRFPLFIAGTAVTSTSGGVVRSGSANTNNSPINVVGGGTVLNAYGVALRNSPLGLTIQADFELNHANASNVVFSFSLSSDGTNFSRSTQVDAVYAGTGLAQTNCSAFTNFSQAVLGNAKAIRLERVQSASQGNLTNAIVRYSYFY